MPESAPATSSTPSPATISASPFGITRPALVRRWLWVVVGVVGFLVLVGGFTRLSRAGLSIVEWEVVTGVVPPMGEAAWADAFAAYRASPEGSKVNLDMTVDGFKRIYYIEWAHRLFARLGGLLVIVPLGVFLARGVIPWRRSGPFLVIAALFGFQGFLGWYMVASGLVDRPSVSHLRLTAHLMAALALLALTMWLALRLGRDEVDGAHGWSLAGNRREVESAAIGLPEGHQARSQSAAFDRGTLIAGAVLIGLVVVQVAYGGLVAGLKAGLVSNTWPRMFGQWVPAGLLSQLEPAWRNLIDAPATVHFVHRWLAFGVLAAAVVLWWRLRDVTGPRRARRLVAVMAVLIVVQIGIGVAVIAMHVALPVALLHQATGVVVFALAVALGHTLRHP